MEEKILKALSRYFKILKSEEKAKFILAKESSLLNKKIKIAEKILEKCELCERKCKVNRIKEKEKSKLGFCKVNNKMLISSYFTHLGEEYFFVPSFTVFFWSCTFECQYCQNWTISQRREKPREITEQELWKIIDEHNYCKNFNAVGGEPTPQLLFILKTLKYVKSNIPFVWNSNFYMSQLSMNLLKNIVDVYLSDFKYGNNKCGERLSKVKNYFDIVSRNHLLAFKDSEMVIRHLVLPSHVNCCSKPILNFIAKNFQDKVIVNIINQYHPEYKANQYKDINRYLTTEEFNEVVNYAKKLNLNFIT